MSDILERLRERAKAARDEKTATAIADARHFEEAADEIERLRRSCGEPVPLINRIRKLTNRLKSRGGPGYDWPCQHEEMKECALSECQLIGQCKDAPNIKAVS